MTRHEHGNMYVIPGKRRHRPRQLTNPAGQRRSVGRPMKRAADISNTREVKGTRFRQSDFLPRQEINAYESNLSPLERLPTELIQQIFFHCFEIGLTQASRQLCSVLSTESTYNALILFAFFEDDRIHPVETRHFLPAHYRKLSLHERLRLQAGIIRCRWCTLSRIRQCMPILSRLNMVQEWYREHATDERLLADNTKIENITFEGEHQQPVTASQLPDLKDQQRLELYFRARSAGNRDLHHLRSPVQPQQTSYLPRIMTWRVSRQDKVAGISYKIQDEARSVLAARVVSDHLLVGVSSGTDELEFLKMLLQGLYFMRQDIIVHVSITAVFEGMRSAIKSSDVAALKVLLELHTSLFEDFTSRALGCLVPKSYHPLPIEFFHLATMQGRNSSTLLWNLIRVGIDSIRCDDEILTGWAVRARAEDDKVARWLLRFMSGSYDSPTSLVGQGYLFTHGRSLWDKPDDDSPYEELDFRQELGYPLPHNRVGSLRLITEPLYDYRH